MRVGTSIPSCYIIKCLISPQNKSQDMQRNEKYDPYTRKKEDKKTACEATECWI